MLDELLQKQDIDIYRHQQLLYHSSLPLWVNSKELPPIPPPPEWLQELEEDED